MSDSPWQPWGNHPEPGPKVRLWAMWNWLRSRLHAEFHRGQWHWVIHYRGRRIYADTVAPHWMPMPPAKPKKKGAKYCSAPQRGQQ